MEFGWKGPSLVGDLKRVVAAEQLGYDSAWFNDSQMINSDIYVTMAVAATLTKKIKIGTGVSVAGTRIAPVTACAMATLNKVAPGRMFISISSGNTAWRLMGQRPQLKIGELEDYINVVRELVNGREVDFSIGENTAPIQFRDRDGDAIDVQHRIPVYVVGAGPKKRALAGRVGDGLLGLRPPTPAAARAVMDQVRVGADQIGRELPEDFVYATGGTVIVLDRAEDILSDEVLAVAGPMVMRRFHNIYTGYLESGKEPAAEDLPADIAKVWPDYFALLNSEPLERRHYRVNAGHGQFVHEDELRFVTPESIRKSMVIGRPEEIMEELRAYEAAGVDMFYNQVPPNDWGTKATERFAKLVIAKM